MKTIPNYMLRKLRGRRGLELDDSSKDESIKNMSPVAIVQECTAWELGDPSWAYTIARWMRDAGANPEDFV